MCRHSQCAWQVLAVKVKSPGVQLYAGGGASPAPAAGGMTYIVVVVTAPPVVLGIALRAREQWMAMTPTMNPIRIVMRTYEAKTLST